MSEARLVNFDDPDHRNRVRGFVAGLKGMWNVLITPYKPKRSSKALGYYWSCVVTPFQRFLRTHGQYWELEEIHSYWLALLAPKELVDPLTGEVLGIVGTRTGTMDSARFYQFVEDCRGWLMWKFDLETEDPDPLWWLNKKDKAECRRTTKS